MARMDDTIRSYEVREVVATFHDAGRFERAVEQLESAGIRREAINMIASHDAVKRKLGTHFAEADDIGHDDSIPQPIFEDRREVRQDERLAVGIPAYIGAAAGGIAVIATGGTIAFAALIAAAAGAVGAGIGGLIAHAIGEHHAHHLERELAKGGLVVTAEVDGEDEEDRAVAILRETGGEGAHAHSLTRYEVFDRQPLPMFDPYEHMLW